MPAPITASALLAAFARRGFTLRAAAGRLAVSPAADLTATDREVIRERRDELLAILSPGEPWNQDAAIRLMHDADALVECLGIDGRHPTVAAAAAVVTSALATRDLETVRFAVAEFTALVRELACGRVDAGGTGQTRANPDESVLPLAERWRHPQVTRTACQRSGYRSSRVAGVSDVAN